jgi:hypothetical protein
MGLNVTHQTASAPREGKRDAIWSTKWCKKIKQCAQMVLPFGLMQISRSPRFGPTVMGTEVPSGMSHFPQKHWKFGANGFLAIRYAKQMTSKFCNILGVQKLNSRFRWYSECNRKSQVYQIRDFKSFKAEHLFI